MTTLQIFVVDHRGVDRPGGHNAPTDVQPYGNIIKVWNPRLNGSLDESRYADYVAFHGAWMSLRLHPPDMIGFFGYRKYLWSPSWYPLWPKAHCEHAPGWVHVSRGAFDAYREYLSTWDGAEIKKQLEYCDLIQSAPYIYPPQFGGLVNDFVLHCGSEIAGNALVEAVKKHDLYDHTVNQNWPNFLMITHWSIFHCMMREIHPIMQELDWYKGDDSTNESYKERPNLYFLERIYPLWLAKSGLHFVEVPLLHCREMGPTAPGW